MYKNCSYEKIVRKTNKNLKGNQKKLHGSCVETNTRRRNEMAVLKILSELFVLIYLYYQCCISLLHKNTRTVAKEEDSKKYEK